MGIPLKRKICSLPLSQIAATHRKHDRTDNGSAHTIGKKDAFNRADGFIQVSHQLGLHGHRNACYSCNDR